MNLITKATSKLPPSYRSQLKELIALLTDVGRKTNYSQWGEDAYLQSYFREKYLADNPTKAMPLLLQAKLVGRGYYVDVGAYAPKLFSNTYWFYKQGWTGINIDGAPNSMQAFERVRPRDRNIEAVISDKVTAMVFYHWESPFLVNTLSLDMAERWSEILGRAPTKVEVMTQRLDSLLRSNLPKDQTISFLSVDAEGHDLQVLRSNDWQAFRPELVLAESHLLDHGEIADSPVARFMTGVDYRICAWIGPTVVYRDKLVEDFRFGHQ